MNTCLVRAVYERHILEIQGIPQGSILGLVLFNIFINDMDDGAERILSKSADDTKLGVADTPESCAAVQRDLDRLEKRANRNLVKFIKEKLKALHLRQNNFMHQDMLKANWFESNLPGKDLVDISLNRSQH